MKFAASIFLASALFASSDGLADTSYEVCTPEGLCTLRVTDTNTKLPVWLVTEDSSDLNLIWSGTFWLVSNEDYNSVRELVKERLVLPAVDPTSDITLQERKANPPKPAPAPAPAPSGGGSTSGGGGSLITVGNITIGGGSANCTDCHTGNMKQIHAKVLPENASK